MSDNMYARSGFLKTLFSILVLSGALFVFSLPIIALAQFPGAPGAPPNPGAPGGGSSGGPPAGPPAGPPGGGFGSGDGGNDSGGGFGSGDGGNDSGGGFGSGDGGNPGGGTELENPLGYNDLASFLADILDAVVLIAFPFLILALVYAGFLFVIAQGNESKLSEARRTFIWVLIGALLVLGAKALAVAINATVEELRTQNASLPTDHILAMRSGEKNTTQI